MTSNDIEEIAKLLGEDMLSREEKDKFLNTIRELNEDEKVVKDWMWEEYNFISEISGKTIEEIKK